MSRRTAAVVGALLTAGVLSCAVASPRDAFIDSGTAPLPGDAALALDPGPEAAAGVGTVPERAREQSTQESPGAPDDLEWRHMVEFAVGEIAEVGDNGVRVGIEYEYLLSAPSLANQLGVGFMVDGDTRTIEEALFAVQAVYHPVEPLGLIAAPGFVLRRDEPTSALLRLGIKWDFALAPRWVIAPEFFYDFLEEGERNHILSLALGYRF